MSLKQWWAAHQHDERERLELVFNLIPVLALGQIVYFTLLPRWRVTR